MPRLDKLLILASATIFVNACADQMQHQYQEVISDSNKVISKLETCSNRFDKTDAYHQIADVIVTSQNDPDALEKYGINEPATDLQKADLKEYRALLSTCKTEAVEDLSEVHSFLAARMAHWYRLSDDLARALAQGDMTVGEFNQKLNQRPTEDRRIHCRECHHGANSDYVFLGVTPWL